ncbi:serine/threonine protein kinase [Mesorhizobium sp. M7A.F.Ca.CA.001.04.1.1]|uniref:serine/threonine-protein kinase n=1 Tax=Mesorhizobium sp. M7A.F.Ca.CA.001.04.1.1 TaxID=2496714 RepID=UPI000FCBA498|nr:serine/threonine-protein kinase [Mesorhizobium sp. M7A.F.Ca.CA.001.04.1.1]RUZ29145.1 serine/threonine protein kinase [Mesorhizobium sp. M7A.F.Ca.CA.001.04.1.1]
MGSDDKTRISGGMANTVVGTQLSGIYELDERIAFGGMGEVYRGHNIQTGDHVAIKIVLPEFARDQTILSLFRKEALILNHLSHDAVVRYHVFTIDPGIGRPYLAMEFVDGESLFDIMRRGAMPAADVRKLCHRLASGLSAVHQAGAIHRDLSPDNIILPGGRVDRAKIIDFGIARSASVGGETLIGGKFAGKYNYVSPEQLGLYSGDVSEQSDIYSLGLVLVAALRGKPIDMSGSQFEVIEKRRTVPDLTDIDDDFRDIVEPMLQPDPQDRPVSMAEIARMTRDENEETPPPASITPRDRSALPRTFASGSKTQARSHNVERHDDAAAAGPGGQPFVEHVRPAHLFERPPAAPMPREATARLPGRSTRTRTLAIAALAMLAVASGAGLYLGGFMTPATPTAGKTSLLAPEPSKLPPGLSKPPLADSAAPEPAKAVSPVQASGQAAENPADTLGVQKPEPTKPAEVPSQNDVVAKPPATDARPRPEKASPPIQPDTMTSDSQTLAASSETTAPTPAVEKASTLPPAEPKVDESQKPEPQASKPAAPATREPNPTAAPPAVANAESPALPTSNQPDQPAVALNVPKPEIPPAVDDIAQRVSWVRDFGGGDCFYATMTSATDKAAAIEGFGTSVQPFEGMLAEFQAKFHVEPDISVRLIEPSQCEVTNFLRFIGQTASDKPQLVLDRTSVPNGTPISGTLVTRGGLRSSVLLIDHKGMVFNLDDRIVVEPGKATFSIPIGLGAADKAAGKAVPQIIMVITGPQDIQAAAFSTPMPASVLLPKILEEIETDGSQFSATAQYFRLGG